MQTVCIKIGGATIDAPGLLEELARSIKAMSQDTFAVVIHGGGKDIARQLAMMRKEFAFVEGMRVTDAETLRQVEMVLSGCVNKRIVNHLLLGGLNAVGLSGVDGNLISAVRMRVSGQDVGFVGSVARVNTALLEICRTHHVVPVLSPVSRSDAGDIYNVNADVAASEIAIALNADHLIFISNVSGVVVNNEVVRRIRLDDIETMVENEQVTGGMIPKLRSAADAVRRGAKRVHIAGWHGQQTLGDELKVETSSGTVIF
ncbi:MAG: acetylglutamate kinase [Chitinivibrionales bacterium]|nr:acetylglutamate kinase [Chitinivibrionales bacterium]